MTMLASQKRPIPRWKWLLGTAVVAIPLLLGIGLTKDPSYIPSMIVGRTLPTFSLEPLAGSGQVASEKLLGKPLVINFWASWCVSCREEHPLLVQLGDRADLFGEFEIVGINYRDSPTAAAQFLDRHGRFPYPSGQDKRGRLGIDFGVYGMPETFFVDAEGVVQARQVGPLTPQAIEQNLKLIGAVR
jgi:cytochrome c biogenesis protein CcmG/thiol:disulfide interchange protein DsbE